MKLRSQAMAAEVFALAIHLSAQTPAPGQSGELRFEVVSVKPLPAGSNSGVVRPAGATRFHGQFNVVDAVGVAYQIRSNRIVGSPSWAKDQVYEINATSSTPRKSGDLMAMMRGVLEERFHLKAHRERRPMPVDVLVLARSDGRLGPQLLRVERDCSNPASTQKCGFGWELGRYRAAGQQWESFVANLEVDATRPVIDKTGLAGQFDIALEWNPGLSGPRDGTSGSSTLADLEARPALTTALREQLGLKLEPATEPLDVIVIDSVERPSPD